MPKTEDDLERVTVRLITGNKDTLQRFYPKAGYNRVIRALISRHCRELEENYSKELSKVKLTEEQLA